MKTLPRHWPKINGVDFIDREITAALCAYELGIHNGVTHVFGEVKEQVFRCLVGEDDVPFPGIFAQRTEIFVNHCRVIHVVPQVVDAVNALFPYFIIGVGANHRVFFDSEVVKLVVCLIDAIEVTVVFAPGGACVQVSLGVNTTG